mgnify:CR=1 FL=1
MELLGVMLVPLIMAGTALYAMTRRVDVYDALVSKRCYKDALPAQRAMDLILQGQCGAFNPKLLDCFVRAEPGLRKLYESEKGL